MASRRFPGKTLAPFRGEPVIRHVMERVQSALPGIPPLVATSDEPSDDPLAFYLSRLGVTVFRGPLDDVVARFRACLAEHPCTWILRVSADSPLLSPEVLQAVVERAGEQWDLVTTIFPRTFPKGHNAELIRADVFQRLEHEALTADDREHVTAFYYRNAGRFRIVNVESGDPRRAEMSVAVDDVDDLRRLEASADTLLRQLVYKLPAAASR